MRLLLSLLLLLSACFSGTKSTSKVARLNIGAEPNSLDPRAARTLNDLILSKMIFEGLTRIGANNEPELALARSVEISADLKTYTFQLNPSAWSNGIPLTAHDFVYAWKSALNPSFSSSYASHLFCLKNARQIKEGVLDSSLLGAKAVDDYTLVIELDYPVPYFLQLVALPIFFPICEKIDQEKPCWMQSASQFICNGPFKPVEWVHSDHLQVKKNTLYWDADKVKLEGVELLMVAEDTELKLFEKGGLHWAGSPLSRLPIDSLSAFREKGALQTVPILGTSFIRANIEHGPLANGSIRRALALAIDRKALIDHVVQGGQLPATRLVPPSLNIQEENYFTDGQIDEARLLFAQGLEELHLSKEEFPAIKLSYATADLNQRMVQLIQDQWRKALGIEVALDESERKIYFSRLAAHDYDLALGAWTADLADPIDFLGLFKYKSYSINNTQWEDPTYRSLLDASFQSLDDEERRKLLSDSEKILMRAMPIIPLYHSALLFLRDPHLKGVVLTSLGSLDLKWADIDYEE